MAFDGCCRDTQQFSCLLDRHSGKESQPLAPAAPEAIMEEAPIAELTDTGEQSQLIVERPTDGPEQDPFALRAAEPVQTFFDKNERKLVAQILEVKADSLKVRRDSDGKELELPVAMLSAEDQAFAAYLWQQQPSKATPKPSQSMEDLIWDELFK